MEEHGEGEADPEDDHEWKEKEAIFKGFTALCGIYFFFMAEKIVGLIGDYRATRKAEQVRDSIFALWMLQLLVDLYWYIVQCRPTYTMNFV